MKAFLQRVRMNGVISAVVWIVLGLLLLLWPETSQKALCYFTGAVLLVQGIVLLAAGVRQREKSLYDMGALALGVVVAAVGVWMLAQPQAMWAFLSVVLSILILLHGAEDISFALQLRRAGYARWWLALLVAAVTLLVGLLLLTHPGFFADILLAFAGIGLVVDGATDLWVWWMLSRALKRAQEQRDD